MGGKHTILHAVEIAPMDRRHESACGETEDNVRCEVMLAESMAQLEVLVEHRAKREGD